MTSEPRTKAGRALLEQAGDWDYFGTVPTDNLATWVDRIEAEAVRDALTTLRAAVEALRESEWRECNGACHDRTVDAVLALIDEAQKGADE